MGNLLTNASGLDGATGWTALGAGALAVDETTVGGPGRAVIRSAGAGAPGDVVGLVSAFVAVAAGQVVEAAGRNAAVGGAWAQQLVWRDAGGAALAPTPIPLAYTGFGPARRGLPATFNYGYLRAAAPANAASVALQVQTTLGQGDGAYAVYALKPFLGAAPADPRPTRWDPGAHVNPDLQLEIWPSILPPFRSDGLATPIANAKAWAGDAGIPIRETLYQDLHQEFRGQMRLSLEQWDALDAFYESSGDDEFYVVRPDTDQLCVAEWLADGAPKPASVSGPWIIAEVGLHLRVA